MRTVNKSLLIYLTIVSLINIFLFFATAILAKKHLFFFLTFWSFWMNLLYLIIICITELYIFFFQDYRYEKINNFFKNIYSRISFTFSYSITLLYWILYFLGNNFLRVRKGFLPYCFHIYMHGIITILLLIDLIMNYHEYKPYNYKEVIIISFIYFLYVMNAAFAKYFFNSCPYAFMEKASLNQLIISSLIMYMIVLNCYQIHVLLLKIKNDKINKKNREEINNIVNDNSEIREIKIAISKNSIN
jgi:hypothetical protein